MQTLRQHQPTGAPVPHPGIGLDCETASLMRGFLLPIFETARDWSDLRQRLVSKGYDIAFRDGHMVLLNLDTREALCTGTVLGSPLRSLAARLGRAHVIANRDGATGELG
ncbi:hypothetical protein [Puniceibacterium confluentis]|uniref:hypothetical protein n=1 Tax=Puniceibacterium confluentis TaxID=1958944 RepID=UPI0011B81535|nr:hypothetical protein [Puniceibacterium confluentis]